VKALKAPMNADTAPIAADGLASRFEQVPTSPLSAGIGAVSAFVGASRGLSQNHSLC